MKELRRCAICHEEMMVEESFHNAEITHVECAHKECEAIRIHVKAKGLDKAKEHINKECPHA